MCYGKGEGKNVHDNNDIESIMIDREECIIYNT